MTKHFRLEFDYETEPARCGNRELIQVRLLSGRATGLSDHDSDAIDTLLRSFFQFVGFDGNDRITETPDGITVRLK